MAIIRPPISGDSPQDSWMNQVTEAINKGLLAPSVNPSEAAVISVNSFSAATVYLYTRTTMQLLLLLLLKTLLMIIVKLALQLRLLLVRLIGKLLLQAQLTVIIFG